VGRRSNTRTLTRILLAEDDALLREILQEGLEAEGFEVVAAGDGEAALEVYLAAGPFDALLLDEEMPRLTGRGLLARVRGAGDPIPALLVSGNLELSAEECRSLGIPPVVRKPVGIDELSRELRRLTGGPRLG
jgi:CheY-like chemotaxis protein